MLDPIFVGLADAARFIGCGRSTFYKLIAAGQIEAVKQGRRTLVSVSSLRGYAATLPSFNVASADHIAVARGDGGGGSADD